MNVNINYLPHTKDGKETIIHVGREKQCRIDADGEVMVFGDSHIHAFSKHEGDQLYTVSFSPRHQISDLISAPGYYFLEHYSLVNRDLVKQVYETKSGTISTFSHFRRLQNIFELRPSGVLDKDYLMSSTGIRILHKQAIVHLDEERNVIEYEGNPLIHHSELNLEENKIYLYEQDSYFNGQFTTFWYNRFCYHIGSSALLDYKEKLNEHKI